MFRCFLIAVVVVPLLGSIVTFGRLAADEPAKPDSHPTTAATTAAAGEEVVITTHYKWWKGPVDVATAIAPIAVLVFIALQLMGLRADINRIAESRESSSKS